MKPRVDTLLTTSAMSLLGEAVPKLAGDYIEGSVRTQAFLQLLLAPIFDGAADNRVKDIEAMRRLFRRAAKACPDAVVGGELLAASRGKTGSLRLGVLDEVWSALARQMIALQTLAEDTPTPWGKAITRACNRLMAESAGRHLIQVPPM